MKRILYAITPLLLFSGLWGCIKDEIDNPEDGQTVSIHAVLPGMSAPETYAMGAAAENKVSTVDILVFKVAGDNTETFVERVTGAIASDDGAGKIKFTAAVTPATDSRVVIVANATAAVTAALSGKSAGASKADILSALKITDTGKWTATSSSSYTAIPMYGETAKVNITSGASFGTTAAPIKLYRMLARIDVVNAATANFTLSEVYLVNRNTAGYVSPAWNAPSGALQGTLPATPMIPSGVQQTGDANKLTYTYVAGGLNGEIYTFEAAATSGVEGNATHTNAVCLIVKGTYGGKTWYYRLDFTAGTDAAGIAAGAAGFNPSTVKYLPVYRNHLYTFTIQKALGVGYATFDDALKSLAVMNNLRAELLVVDQSAMKDVVFNGQHWLGTGGETMAAYVQNEVIDLPVMTNYTYGWQIDASTHTNGIEYVSGTGWLSAAKNGTGDALKLTSLSGFGATEHTAYVHLSAGRLRHKVKVTQGGKIDGDGSTLPEEEDHFIYVGAFWRVDQTGERLIRIPGSGAWTAQVYEYGPDFQPGDIVFSTDPSTDPNIYSATTADMNVAANDAAYQVDGTKTYATGNAATGGGFVYFRVGLKTKWNAQPGYNSDTKPARYAVIMLSYNNNTKFQKIFLRQGHEADYLMSKTDGSGNGSLTSRPLAAKYSPYNLTAPAYLSSGGRSSAESILVEARGGVMTEYPSQAGAFFHWVRPNGKYVFHPTNPIFTTPTNFATNDQSEYWATIGTANETCPTGYRRPTNGSTTNAAVTITVDNTEIGQSLWWNQAGGTARLVDELVNAAWGFYADGFFDRRPLETQQVPSGRKTTNKAVEINTSTVAYIGRLFYNPNNPATNSHYNASLFFPAAGHRTPWPTYPHPPGVLVSAGIQGHYLSSSAENLVGAWNFNFGYYFIVRNSAGYEYAFSVRCVKE